jgi:threonine synthase
VLAHNANRTVLEYLETGTLSPRPSVATLASAMDVGSPSNLERMSALYPDAQQLGAALSAVSIDDDAIRARIRADYARFGQVWCPHTATAAETWARMSAERQASRRWVLVSTAHPAKFREIVEPLIGRPVEVPGNLQRLFELPSSFTEIPATLDALRAATGRR